jgi:hypothetical protein
LASMSGFESLAATLLSEELTLILDAGALYKLLVTSSAPL